MGTVLVAAALTAAVFLLFVILRRIDDIPARAVYFIDRRRAQDEAKAVTALQEATAVKVGALVMSLRSYEEQRATMFREELANARARVRSAERRAADTDSALGAAALVADLRTLRDDLALLLQSAPPPLPRPAPDPDPEERPTIELPAPTDPGLVAAGLGPRPPGSGTRPAVAEGLVRCVANDGDRASDEEMTTVGARPPQLTARTLPSMRALPPPVPRPAPQVEVDREEVPRPDHR